MLRFNVNMLIIVLALFNHVTAQSVSLSIIDGSSPLDESIVPYQFCVTLSEPPSGADLTVSIAPSGFATATAPEDFIISSDMLSFADGTNDLQQCFNVTIVDDSLVEQQEVFTLTATPSSGLPTNLLVFIRNDDTALIGFDQESYTTNELDGSITVCVIFLEGTGIEDTQISIEPSIAVTSDTALDGEDFNQPVPLTVTLTSVTPSSGACSTINILPDSIEEGRETFNISLINAPALATVAGGRGIAQVLIVDVCGSLAAPEDGNVDASNRTVGSVATYSCDSGFLARGNPQRDCQADGFWSGQAPICIPDSTEPTPTQSTDSTQAPLNLGIRAGANGLFFVVTVLATIVIHI